MHNLLHSYFHDVFHMDPVSAGILAFAFGGMNLFARPMGGMLSDWANRKAAMRGRLWVHFISLFGQGVTLFCFASVGPAQGWGLALFWLCIFSIFVKMAEGTTYGIVPFMIPEHLAVVGSVVGAGGTLGAVIASSIFYRFAADDATGMKFHALYITVISFTVLALKWEKRGSMWSPGTQSIATSAPASVPDQPDKLACVPDELAGQPLPKAAVPEEVHPAASI